MRLRCDSCATGAPPDVGPILIGIRKWGTFELDGEQDGRAYVASVLLCPQCTVKMRAFVATGGRAGEGPKPPDIRTFRGGRDTEPEWASTPREFNPLGGAARGVGRCVCAAGPGTNPACEVHP